MNRHHQSSSCVSFSDMALALVSKSQTSKHRRRQFSRGLLLWLGASVCKCLCADDYLSVCVCMCRCVRTQGGVLMQRCSQELGDVIAFLWVRSRGYMLFRTPPLAPSPLQSHHQPPLSPPLPPHLSNHAPPHATPRHAPSAPSIFSLCSLLLRESKVVFFLTLALHPLKHLQF